MLPGAVFREKQRMLTAGSAIADLLRHLGSRVLELEMEQSRRAGLGVVVEIYDDDGNPINKKDFTERKKTAIDHVPHGKPYKIPKRVMDTIVARTNNYWSILLGSQVHFKIAEIDLAFMTTSDTALFRNTFLSGFFVHPPVVVDAYAGIGMDTISFLYNLFCRPEIGIKCIYSVENSDDEARNERLQYNVQEYIRAKEGIPDNAMIPVTGESLGSRVEFYLNGTEKFFEKCKHFKVNPVTSIDLLYIDPPWKLSGRPNSGANGEATSSELLNFLYDTILKHLVEHDVKVRMVCIKTRFTWEECRPFLDILRAHMKNQTDEFTHTTTIKNKPFKNVYYFHVIKTNEADYGEWQQSQVFQMAYDTMKKKQEEGTEDPHNIVRYTKDGQVEIINSDRLRDGKMDYKRHTPGEEDGEEYRPSRDYLPYERRLPTNWQY
jgi:hypothetical protein